MREVNQAVERLMAGLRDAEPSPGMESRILKALEAHEAQASTPFRHPLLKLPLMRSAFAAPLLCAAALATLIVAIQANQPSHRAADASNGATQAQTKSATLPETIAMKAPIELRRAVRVSARHPRQRDVPETKTTSYPAPPLPLTEQEKLLLRVAHRNDADNKAFLNPDLQATQSAKATEQFRQFFGMNPKEMRKESE
jgi:hypothetical protein